MIEWSRHARGRRAMTVGSMGRALSSPIRNLSAGAAFVLLVIVIGISAYRLSGWNLGDAVYMVILTVFTVGYDEVRPIDTPDLRAITITLILFGCTGMIFVTGALVQFITATQFAELLGGRRMNLKIEKLRNHVIVCGYGRIGGQLARALHAANAAFVVIDADQSRYTDAQERGCLCLHGDATDEAWLQQAGIAYARSIVTVLPDDAANVFITLSARSLNKDLYIIARGEAPSTEGKLRQAGADEVVLPAHIGAERMAELLLFPEAGAPVGVRTMEEQLRSVGLSIAVVVAEEGSPWVGLTVQEIEASADAGFLIVELERSVGGVRERAREDMRLQAGDGVVVIGRSVHGALQGFMARSV